jgi:hypothetical protein
LMCFAAHSTFPLVFILLASVVVVVVRPFGNVAPAGNLDNVISDLAQAHGDVTVAPPTNALAASTLIALPIVSGLSHISSRFALVFRDEISTAKWRMLATRLRMQRGPNRAE